MRFYGEAANRVADTRKAADVPAHMLPLEQFVARARSDWRGGDVGSVAVSFPNDAHAAVGATQLAEHLPPMRRRSCSMPSMASACSAAGRRAVPARRAV